MIAINFPEHDFKLKESEGKTYIFDFFRKKWVQLSPEEWVRQNILIYLTKTLHYPMGFISVEKLIIVNQLRKRYDIVVYNTDRTPWMLIECKAPEVAITDRTLNQLLNYYSLMQSPYCLLTNGKNTYCAQMNNGSVHWMNHLPVYDF